MTFRTSAILVVALISTLSFAPPREQGKPIEDPRRREENKPKTQLSEKEIQRRAEEEAARKRQEESGSAGISGNVKGGGAKPQQGGATAETHDTAGKQRTMREMADRDGRPLADPEIKDTESLKAAAQKNLEQAEATAVIEGIEKMTKQLGEDAKAQSGLRSLYGLMFKAKGSVGKFMRNMVERLGGVTKENLITMQAAVCPSKCGNPASTTQKSTCRGVTRFMGAALAAGLTGVALTKAFESFMDGETVKFETKPEPTSLKLAKLEPVPEEELTLPDDTKE